MINAFARYEKARRCSVSQTIAIVVSPLGVDKYIYGGAASGYNCDPTSQQCPPITETIVNIFNSMDLSLNSSTIAGDGTQTGPLSGAHKRTYQACVSFLPRLCARACLRDSCLKLLITCRDRSLAENARSDATLARLTTLMSRHVRGVGGKARSATSVLRGEREG